MEHEAARCGGAYPKPLDLGGVYGTWGMLEYERGEGGYFVLFGSRLGRMVLRLLNDHHQSLGWLAVKRVVVVSCNRESWDF